MKRVILFIALSTAFFSANCQSLLPEAELTLVLPNTQWPELTRAKVGERILYFSKRTPVTDKAGKKIIPNIDITLEALPENVDLKTFSDAILEDLKTASARDKQTLRVLTKYAFGDADHIIPSKDVIGYKTSYKDQNLISHLVYVVYIVNNWFGVQAIFDTTENLTAQISPEFLNTIRSIRVTH